MSCAGVVTCVLLIVRMMMLRLLLLVIVLVRLLHLVVTLFLQACQLVIHVLKLVILVMAATQSQF